MNKEIEKTLMNGDYESAYRLIQENIAVRNMIMILFHICHTITPELVNMIRHMMCPARLWI